MTGESGIKLSARQAIFKLTGHNFRFNLEPYSCGGVRHPDWFKINSRAGQVPDVENSFYCKKPRPSNLPLIANKNQLP